MILQEKDIIHRFLINNLSEHEHKELKQFLKTEESYQNFSNKLLGILIGKDKGTSLKDILEFHHLAFKASDFKNSINVVIEDLAELSFKGIQSEFADWLKATNNSVYQNHLTFLLQTSKGIKATERAALRERISSFEKLDAFDLSESDVKTGIRILERNAFRKRFKERTNINKVKRSRIKKSTVVVLILLGSVVIAMTVPQIRHVITHYIQEIFNQKEENHESEGSIIQPPSRPDTTVIESTTDSIKKPVDSVAIQKLPLKKITPLRLYNSGKIITAETYRKHFIKHKNDLEKIEGIWDLNGKFKGHPLPVKVKCAIRKIEEGKFELVFFNPNELLWDKLSTKYYLHSSEDNSTFIVSEFINKRPLSPKSAHLSKSGKLTLQNSFIFSEFGQKTDERVIANFNGSKEMLNSDMLH